MELSRQQEAQMRRIGRNALQKAVSAATANNDGMKRMIGRVTKVNIDYTVNVDFGSENYPMPITGVRYTTACHGVQVGDRAIVDVVGHLAICSGILANSDNGPYVRAGVRRFGAFTPGYGGTYTIDTGLAGNVAAIVGNASTGTGWTWARFALAEVSGGTIKVAAFNDSTATIPDGAFSWVAVGLR